MKTSQIEIGNNYEIQLGKNTAKVKVVSLESGTWFCETYSGKTLKVKDAKRFIKAVKEKAKSIRETVESNDVTIILRGKRATSSMKEADETPKHMGPKPLGDMSALTAAHRVLVEEARPMRVREITNTVLERGYCKLNGKTPHCTINGGMQKEIKTKGENSRFQWVGKGLFAAR